LFVPDRTGNWIFYLASDDSSLLFLNPLGPDPVDITTATPLLEETGCCNQWATHTSTPQALTAGQRYYITALYKEGTGGDYVKVAATLDSDPAPWDNPSGQIPISVFSVPSQLLGAFVDKTGAHIDISQQPADALAAIDPNGATHPSITFSVTATG